MTRRVVIQFVKAPRLGTVKTRLARDIGAAEALRFHRWTSTAVARRLARSRRWHTVLYVTPDAFAHQGRFWPPGLARRGQGSGDLGRRMAAALTDWPGADTVLIGGDIPDVTRAHIGHAFAALGRADVVFGPADDGGYWLVGLKAGRRPFRFLRGLRWSTPETLNDSIATLRPRWRVGLVDRLTDIDDAADWRDWRAELSARPERPHLGANS